MKIVRLRHGVSDSPQGRYMLRNRRGAEARRPQVWQARQAAQEGAVSFSLVLPRLVLNIPQQLLMALVPFLQLPRPSAATKAVPSEINARSASMPWLEAEPTVWVKEGRRTPNITPTGPSVTSGTGNTVQVTAAPHDTGSTVPSGGPGQGANTRVAGQHSPAQMANDSLPLPASITSILHMTVMQNQVGRGAHTRRTSRQPAALAPKAPSSISLARPAAAVHAPLLFLLPGQMFGRVSMPAARSDNAAMPYLSDPWSPVRQPQPPAVLTAAAVAPKQAETDHYSGPAAAQAGQQLVWRAALDGESGRGDLLSTQSGPRTSGVPAYPSPLPANHARAPAYPNPQFATGSSLVHLALMQETVVHTVKKQVTLELEHQREALARHAAPPSRANAPAGRTMALAEGMTNEAVVQLLLSKLRTLLQEERFRQGWIR